jgi:leucyl-tRNA---protein transferase
VPRTLTLTSSLESCEYLPDRVRRLRYDLNLDLQPAGYMRRLLAGWRRFGYTMFRPECPSCSMCQSLRVPTSSFQPTQSQRRVWKNNEDVTVRIGSPVISPERLALWETFHRHGEQAKGWPPDAAASPEVMLRNPFPIEEWDYYAGERLIAVGYVDPLPQALSAIYFYWAPDERSRSLGTFNILSLLGVARERHLAHVYLGYYVKGCRSLEYKARFKPNEVLREGRWEAFDERATTERAGRGKRGTVVS